MANFRFEISISQVIFLKSWCDADYDGMWFVDGDVLQLMLWRDKRSRNLRFWHEKIRRVRSFWSCARFDAFQLVHDMANVSVQSDFKIDGMDLSGNANL